jgi:ankyrin repeat protein
MRGPSLGEKLYSPARHGDVEAIRKLSDKQIREVVNWKHKGNYGQTPLWTAAKYGRVAAATLLLERGASAAVTDDFGVNALHEAAMEGKVLVVAAILDHEPALVNVPTPGGCTPLYVACLNARASVVRLLCSRGANPDAVDANLVSPLMAAVCGNHVECCEELLKRDVSLEATNCMGDAALHLAARLGKASTLMWLLLQGANGARENKRGKIALEEAEEAKQQEAARILRNPPRPSGLARWRPSLHGAFPAAFRQQARELVRVMTRLRRRKDPAGPLWMIPNDIVLMMVRELGDLYRNVKP